MDALRLHHRSFLGEEEQQLELLETAVSPLVIMASAAGLDGDGEAIGRELVREGAEDRGSAREDDAPTGPVTRSSV